MFEERLEILQMTREKGSAKEVFKELTSGEFLVVRTPSFRCPWGGKLLHGVAKKISKSYLFFLMQTVILSLKATLTHQKRISIFDTTYCVD